MCGDICPFTSHLISHFPSSAPFRWWLVYKTVTRMLLFSIISITMCEYHTARPFSFLPKRTKLSSYMRRCLKKKDTTTLIEMRCPLAARPGHSPLAFEMLDLVIYCNHCFVTLSVKKILKNCGGGWIDSAVVL